MPPYSSVPTISNLAGGRCNRSSMPGRKIRRWIFQTMLRADTARPQQMIFWRGTAMPGAPWVDQLTAENGMEQRRKISLALADVDGTLLTEDKVLTERAIAAVRALGDAGIRFAITSGRPPLGMAMLFDALRLDTPIAGFNGGLFVKRDLSILDQKTVPSEIAHRAVELVRKHDLD